MKWPRRFALQVREGTPSGWELGSPHGSLPGAPREPALSCLVWKSPSRANGRLRRRPHGAVPPPATRGSLGPRRTRSRRLRTENPGPACPGRWAVVREQRVPRPLEGCTAGGVGVWGSWALSLPGAGGCSDLAWGPALGEAPEDPPPDGAVAQGLSWRQVSEVPGTGTLTPWGAGGVPSPRPGALTRTRPLRADQPCSPVHVSRWPGALGEVGKGQASVFGHGQVAWRGEGPGPRSSRDRSWRRWGAGPEPGVRGHHGAMGHTRTKHTHAHIRAPAGSRPWPGSGQ